MMISELYVALRAADVSEAEARAAAESVANVKEVSTKTDFALLRSDFRELRADIDAALSKQSSELKTTIINTLIAMTAINAGLILTAIGVAGFVFNFLFKK